MSAAPNHVYGMASTSAEGMAPAAGARRPSAHAMKLVFTGPFDEALWLGILWLCRADGEI